MKKIVFLVKANFIEKPVIVFASWDEDARDNWYNTNCKDDDLYAREDRIVNEFGMYQTEVAKLDALQKLVLKLEQPNS